MASAPLPPQWVIDLNSPPAGKPKSAGIPDPPGYTSTATGGKVDTTSPAQFLILTVLQKQQSSSKTAVRAPPTTEEMDVLKLKKAWEVALAPVKQLPMTAIMMYMSGNSLQIFSIMMVGMAFKNPIMGLMATNQAFEKFETPGTKGSLLMVKAVYVAMQILALALGVWKVNGMGLLPTTRSDWLAWETARDPLEVAIPAF
ncbi:ER membrane protein complex subunit 4 [Lachnellula arida]|uniref:ER membrane protein complex subunit 4 n=1 Tax=Lachnellula arida TaxID=1316785 RepID=A0A8T9B2I8_9HELO|nr:ER membrane protein complex subunit 4 [Lachnellula arida]